MHMLSQGSQSQASGNGSQNSTSPQFPSIFSQTQFSQFSTPTFQNFHPFGAPTNYQPYGNSTPSFNGFQQQAHWLQSTPMSFQEAASKAAESKEGTNKNGEVSDILKIVGQGHFKF
uniref:Uncharacterized protein n=1 Tax=Oryza nivara TaxID=4536 RepID=A0A0E0ID06_ORYNI